MNEKCAYQVSFATGSVLCRDAPRRFKVEYVLSSSLYVPVCGVKQGQNRLFRSPQ